MKPRKIKILPVFVLIIVLIGISAGFTITRYNNNRSIAFKTEGRKLRIFKNGNWNDFTVKGVNIGSGKPGFFPGEMGITRKEYARWFRQIAEMNANVIRVYTILSPDFYRAFFEYNALTKKPLYLLQGIWVDDENIAQSKNAYDKKLTEDFKDEIKKAIDVLHGNAATEPKRGHASGIYRYDVSPYVMGYILAEEMEPDFVIFTNENNDHINGFSGEFIYAENASPYEAWLAAIGDYTVSYEHGKYRGTLKPISWTNWPTTDPIEHLNEPNRTWEDAVSVDFEHIRTSRNFSAGIFASYHIYPHFPDFLRFQPEYINYIDSRGKNNPYEAYLKELIAFHTMPVLVAEFGVPASRGISRKNQALGYNHGHHTETEQGEAIADMFESIVNSGYAGGIVFSWQDEWFKKTWNTEAFDIADNRPFWSNYLVSEQSYGLLAFEPGNKKNICQVDGNISEWKNEKPICAADGLELYAMSDEKFIYLMIKDQKGNVEKDKYYIGADIIDTLGSKTFTAEGITFSRNVDAVVAVNGRENSTVLIEAYQDVYYRYFSHIGGFFERQPAYETKNSGLFNPWLLMMCRQLFLPQTNETVPIEYFDAGKLLHGNSNPVSPDYSNLADFFISPENHAIELRIPWMLFNAADPSTRRFIGDQYMENNFNLNPVKVDGIYFELLKAGSSPAPGFYTWREWGDSPSYHERLKQSYTIVREKFGEY